MTERTFVQEAVTLAAKKSDGTYPVVIITEGEGSSGRYSADLLRRSENVFAGSASFLNHPIDPSKPHLRDVNSIAGRLGQTYLGEDKGKVAILSDFKPRKEYAEFVEEFSDVLALSIYCGAMGEVLEDGRLDVEAFDEEDPYRSVDIVVAAGRGGRFKRAEESLRAIENSLGLPAKDPGSTSAPGNPRERDTMEKEVLEAVVKAAIAEALAPVISFVTEQKAAADDAVAAAEAKAEAAEQEKGAALESFSAAIRAVSEASLLPSQEASILDAAKRGEDVAPLIESAKTIANEAKQAVAAKAPGYVIESAASATDDYRITLLGGGR